ncbi:MAG: transcription-repair coupling factor, partial [Saprospiraceae bacterium]|nr:transcription-repair coupling factor [Saprospiraceae bacterium]
RSQLKTMSNDANKINFVDKTIMTTLEAPSSEPYEWVYQGGDLLYVSVHSLHKISKYVGKDGNPPKMHKLGTQTWANTKKKTKKKIKELAFDLIKLYAQRRATKGFAFPEDGYLQNELEASFIYEDTPDQAKATEAVKVDMMKPYPMDRLICGDVGFGKTEIAIRAAFKAVVAGKQVAILVPTTILALQHAQTFRKRLKQFDIQVEYINRFRTTKEKTQIYKQLKEGKIDILIGTHAILNKKVEFKDLGLLITDEEQKFGVSSKEKIRNRKVNVDTLTLTATPIPRTLQFSLLGARDLSIINTAPPNRQPIHTEVRTFDDRFIKEVIEREVSRGGQVFFLHNRVKSLNDMAAMLQRLCPSIDIGVAHGQMDATQLERTLLDFIKGYYEVLCCTNIIETGLDIPNANTIIISNAHHFGLSDLHQLRGRVGRSNKKAYCYLITPPMSTMTPESRKRLHTIEQFSELGSGFNIAMKDLDIRGAGNMLGAEQSGFIMNMGYETYQKILAETIQELKENEYKELFKEELEQKNEFVREVNVESDLDIFLPNEYVSSIQERLLLYQKLNRVNTEDDIAKYQKELLDRFGKLPQAVHNLLEAIRIRWVAKKLGFERVSLRKRKLKCYFLSNQKSPFFESEHFQSLLQYIQAKSDHRFFLKQTAKTLILICEAVPNLVYAKRLLKEIEDGITVKVTT